MAIVRCQSLRALLACCLFATALQAGDAPGEPTGEQFRDLTARWATHTAAQLRELVVDACSLDPADLSDNREKRRLRRAQQKRMQAWFNERRHDVRWDDCVTDEDRDNFLDFRTVMASRDITALPLRERRRIAEQAAAYADALAERLPETVAAVIDRSGVEARPHLYRLLIERFSQPLPLHPYFFNRTGVAGAIAAYLPDRSEMYLDLNLLAADPQAFYAAFEHEMWHHLMPVGHDGDVHSCPWYEGIIEMLSRLWGAELRRRSGRVLPRQCRAVAYPVQTALMTLAFAANPDALLMAASGMRPLEEAFQEHRDRQHRGGPSAALTALFAASGTVSADELSQTEALLSRWGWREQGGAPIRLGRLAKDERFDEQAVNQAYRNNRRLLLEFIQALSVVRLRTLVDETGEAPLRALAANRGIPPVLQQNMRHVLDYIADPFYQLALR